MDHCNNLNPLTVALILLGLAAEPVVAGEPTHGSPDFKPSPTQPINFRGDPRGGYPGANISLALPKIAWRVEPGRGCGAPLVVGDKVFVISAPNALVCLSKQTGKELWRRTQHAGNLDSKTCISALFDSVMDEIGKLHQLSEKAATEKDEAAKAKLKAEMDAQSAHLCSLMPPGRNTMGEGGPWFLFEIPRSSVQGAYADSGRYMTLRAPCSDGVRVFVWMPTRILAAYDLDGKHLWSADTRLLTPHGFFKDKPARWPWQAAEGALNPVVTPDGVVVLHGRFSIFGFEAATGKQLWRTDAPEIGATFGSPSMGKVGNDWFVATQDGEIVRARDGLLIHKDANHSAAPVHPAFADGVFHWVSHAVRVTPGDPSTGSGQAPPKAELLWELEAADYAILKTGKWTADRPIQGKASGVTKGARMDASADMSAPVLVDGRLVFYDLFWNDTFTILDPANGKVLRQMANPSPQKGAAPHLPDDRDPNVHWPGRISAGPRHPYGGLILVGPDKVAMPSLSGQLSIYTLKDGRPSDNISFAIADDVYAHMVADGSSLYVRSQSQVYRLDFPPAGTKP